MFDQTKEFEIPILSGGEKRCVVRWPTDAEWCEHSARQKTVRRFLGRDRSTVEDVGGERADFDLFSKIRLDVDGPKFDEAEASRVITRLDRHEVLSIQREGVIYRIEMKVSGGEVAHVLRMPTAADALEHERSSVKIIDGRKNREIKVTLEPSARIYDRLRETVEGYAGDVPIVHKVSAVAALMAEYNAENERFEGADPESI